MSDMSDTIPLCAAAAPAAAAALRRILEQLVLTDAGVHLELDAHLADVRRRLCRIARHPGVLRPAPRLDLIFADTGRPDEEHLRRVADAGVAADHLVVVAERGLHPGTVMVAARLVVVGQREHLRAAA